MQTDIKHQIEVQREAIPLVFVPGMMGSVLKLKGTNGKGVGPEDKNGDTLPNLRWDPDSRAFMVNNFSGEEAIHRRHMLIGPDGSEFDANFLAVHNADPIGNGFQGFLAVRTMIFRIFAEQCPLGAVK